MHSLDFLYGAIVHLTFSENLIPHLSLFLCVGSDFIAVDRLLDTCSSVFMF